MTTTTLACGGKMTIEVCKWFAWYPVPLKEGGWAWLKNVIRTAKLVHGRADGCSDDIYFYSYEKMK